MTARVGSWVLAAALLAGGLVACSEQRPQPEAAAEELAAGLASLDLASAPVQDGAGAAQALAEVTQGLGDLSPDVAVQEVRQDEQDEDRAIAVLAYTWDVDQIGSDEQSSSQEQSDAEWTYSTSAPLTYSEEQGWRAQWSPSLLEPSLAEGERLEVRRTAAERGEILGAGGAVLVTDRPVLRLGIDKTLVQPDQAAASAVSLAELVGVEPQAFSERVAAAGPRAFVQALVVRADGSAPVDDASLATIPGAVALPDELPLAPTREFARPLLGSVGEATAELVEQSGGRVRPGDVTGLSGLQLAQDQRLSGRPGTVVQAVAAEPPGGAAPPPRELFALDPVPGEAVATSLDPDLQALAESVLAPVQPASAVVVLQPSTGNVLAAASGPGGQGYSTATLGRYPPGSTFKVVSTLGLLRAGLTGASQVPCPPSITVDGRSFTNYGDYPAAALGDIPLRTAVAQSCNTAFIASREVVPQADLASAAADLGLGGQYDIGVPSFAGSVPEQAGATEHAASMIGQGRVEASPLAMATVAASVAAGHSVEPRLLLQDSRPAAGEPLEEAAQLQELLRAVVSEGSAAFLADVPGSPVGAKTGTAEYGSEQPPRTHAWMLAIHGDLAVVVFVEDGESGASTAGPILEQVLSAG